MSSFPPEAVRRRRRRVVTLTAILLLGVAPLAGAAPTAPPTGAPQRFSSVANVTWCTPADTSRTDPNHSGVRYAQLVTAVAEAGNRLFVAGSFTNLVPPKGSPAAPALPYLAVLDVATGAPVPGAAFNTNAKPDGVINALAVSADG